MRTELSPGCGTTCGWDQGSKPGPEWQNLAITPSGSVSLMNLPQNRGAVGKFSLSGPIYLGGRADEDPGQKTLANKRHFQDMFGR